MAGNDMSDFAKRLILKKRLSLQADELTSRRLGEWRKYRHYPSVVPWISLKAAALVSFIPPNSFFGLGGSLVATAGLYGYKYFQYPVSCVPSKLGVLSLVESALALLPSVARGTIHIFFHLQYDNILSGFAPSLLGTPHGILFSIIVPPLCSACFSVFKRVETKTIFQIFCQQVLSQSLVHVFWRELDCFKAWLLKNWDTLDGRRNCTSHFHVLLTI